MNCLKENLNALIVCENGKNFESLQFIITEMKTNLL